MDVNSNVALTVLATLGAAWLLPFLYKLAKRIVRPLFSPLRLVPGPPSPSWFWGHMKEILDADAMVPHEQWLEAYGPVVRYKGFLNSNRLLTLDTHALGHVLAHPEIYEKPPQVRRSLGEILGQGLLFVEGEKHKQQRRILSPAFGPSQVRELTEIFVDKSIQLRDLWSAEIAQAGEERARIDVLPWLSRMTLDVIGLAGFNYHFNALNSNNERNELNEAVRTMTNTDGRGFLPMLQAFLPIFRHLPTQRNRAIAAASTTMSRIGHQLLAEKKAAVLAGAGGAKSGIGRTDVQGRDIMSLLVKANMATDLPDGARMSDIDVLAQVPTFLIAGHETTSTAVTWALHGLSMRPDAQTKLRAELARVPTDTPTMDALGALPYLDAVVRETLRHYAPVPSTVRFATQDDVIPTDVAWTDVRGAAHRGVRVARGDAVFIPILALGRARALWGADAHEFNPDRWADPPQAAHAIPGVWGHSLAFSGGPRACIGYRFSVVEMKALLFVLVRAFAFALAVAPGEIRKRSSLVQRPFLAGEMERGAQLPLWVTAVRAGAGAGEAARDRGRV